jgi:hypothetical protein
VIDVFVLTIHAHAGTGDLQEICGYDPDSSTSISAQQIRENPR